jgi:hypothetical protein
MALYPYYGPCPLLQFHNLFYRTPWTCDQPLARTLLTHTKTQHRINAYRDIHILSGIRTHDHSIRAGEDSSCFRQRGHSGFTLIYIYKFKHTSEVDSCTCLTTSEDCSCVILLLKSQCHTLYGGVAICFIETACVGTSTEGSDCNSVLR